VNRPSPLLYHVFLIGLTGLFLTGCSTWNGETGVENIWRNPAAADWTPGVSTQNEVIEMLGPPSQLIALQEETLFYYMREASKGSSMNLILWNTSKEDKIYDRAIFFFTADGILRTYSYSPETIPYEPDIQ
jgi:hypothetical protein